MRLRKNIALSESGFIFNPTTGDSFSVNTVGLKVLELLRDGQSEEMVKQELAKMFEVEVEQLNEDFYDFSSHLKQLNLLEDGPSQSNNSGNRS